MIHVYVLLYVIAIILMALGLALPAVICAVGAHSLAPVKRVARAAAPLPVEG